MANTNSQDYKDGYQAAIEAIRQQQQQHDGSNSEVGGARSNGDLPLPPMPGMNGGGDDTDNNTKNEGRGKGDVGVVRPEDCISPEGAQSMGVPGEFISKSDGDKVASEEGYPGKGPGADQIAKEWENAAKQVAQKMKQAGKGEAYNKFAAKINSMYKSKVNWKDALRKIVGRCISEEDKRRGYANKKFLATQNIFVTTNYSDYTNIEYLVVALDMSGSFMGDEDFVYQALTEVSTVALRKKPLKIAVIQWDSNVEDVQIFSSVNELQRALKKGFIMKGGGGTEPECVWKFLKTDKRFKHARPELTMIFTDGEFFGGDPKRNSSIMQHLVWVVIDNPNKELPKDSMTSVVHISMQDTK